MKPNRWRSAGRVLGAGVALVLVLGASEKGCSGGSGGSDSDCPKIEAAGAASLAAAAVSLPAGDLDEDLKRARKIAQEVAEETDGDTCTLTQNKEGYRVTIPFKRRHPIEVRVMARGGGRENYYRVSVVGKSAVDSDGKYSRKDEETHRDLPDDDDDAVDEIVDLVHKTKERHE